VPVTTGLFFHVVKFRPYWFDHPAQSEVMDIFFHQYHPNQFSTTILKTLDITLLSPENNDSRPHQMWNVTCIEHSYCGSTSTMLTVQGLFLL